jgi:uncharacterized protein
MNTETESKAVVQRYVAAVAAGDAQAARELFAPSAEWTLAAGDLPIAGTWEGRDAIIDEFLAIAQSYYAPGSINIEVTGIVAEGPLVVMQWTSRARTRTGRPYENGCIGVFTVADGQIRHVREYMDTLYARDVAFGAEASYSQPNAAETSTAVSSMRSTAGGRL